MRILFLDDNGERHKTFRRNAIGHDLHEAYDARSLIGFMIDTDFDLVYLDHDLGEPESENKLLDDAEDGRFVARWIAASAAGFKQTKTIFVIHSLNEQASESMQATLRAAGLLAWRVPFGWKVTVDDLYPVISSREATGPERESTGGGS